jgi:hypothetical protein
MNELDLLKTHWEKDQDYVKFKKEDILGMLHKSSSSIVKWILIISILEFIVITSYTISNYNTEPESFTIYEVVFQFLSYLVLIVFIYLFFIQYRKIKNFVNTAILSRDILRTSRLAMNYVITNFILLATQLTIGLTFGTHFNAFKKGYEEGYNDGYGSEEIVASPVNDTAMWGIFILTIFALCAIIYVYYRLVIIRLTHKLNKNYEELVAIEAEE